MIGAQIDNLLLVGATLESVSLPGQTNSHESFIDESRTNPHKPQDSYEEASFAADCKEDSHLAEEITMEKSFSSEIEDTTSTAPAPSENDAFASIAVSKNAVSTAFRVPSSDYSSDQSSSSSSESDVYLVESSSSSISFRNDDNSSVNSFSENNENIDLCTVDRRIGCNIGQDAVPEFDKKQDSMYEEESRKTSTEDEVDFIKATSSEESDAGRSRNQELAVTGRRFLAGSSTSAAVASDKARPLSNNSDAASDQDKVLLADNVEINELSTSTESISPVVNSVSNFICLGDSAGINLAFDDQSFAMNSIDQISTASAGRYLNAEFKKKKI